MLQLRPSCENCTKALPADSVVARICSYEWTFVATGVCVLENFCPTGGGGVSPRQGGRAGSG